MKKNLTIFIAVLLMMVGVVSAANGDVTIVVNNQAGTPISGATASLLFVNGNGNMVPKLTDTNGVATFTAGEIATFIATKGYATTVQILMQPGAKVDIGSAYGKVRTVGAATGFPIIPYNIPGANLEVKPAMSFAYNMIMMSAAPVQTIWDDLNQQFTVTATLADDISEIIPNAMAMRLRLIRNLVSGQTPATNDDDDWYLWNGAAYERWIGIGTVNAIQNGVYLSATFPNSTFADWLDGNKAVVRPEIWVNRNVGEVSAIDDYNAVDIMQSYSYIDYPRTQNIGGVGADFVALSVPDYINYGTLYSFSGFKSQTKDTTLNNMGTLNVKVTPVLDFGKSAEVFNYINFAADGPSGVIGSFFTSINKSCVMNGEVFTCNSPKPLATWIQLTQDIGAVKGPQTGKIYFQATETV